MRPRSVAAFAGLGAFGILQWLGRTYGATAREQRRSLPGDELVADPRIVTTHAITIDAPPSDVWPWLVQMGWHRAGWYTSRWVDRALFPANWPSADRIVPELQHLAVGDRIPDGPPDSGAELVVVELERDRHLVLHSTHHLPPGWERRFHAWLDWSWAFILEEVDSGRTRFVVRSRARTGPWWVALLYELLVPADFVMARQMLRGVQGRAQSADRRAPIAIPVSGREAGGSV
jgi:hypothetical protein